jgi:TolB protein
MNLDGTGVTKLTNDPVGAGQAAFSPDGSKIVYRSESDGALYVMNSDGSGRVRLVSGGSNPAWSHDGRQIAFASGQEIYSIAIAGGVPRRLTDNAGPDDMPAWSPDDQRIAFLSFLDGQMGLFEMNSDGTQVVRRVRMGSRTVHGRPVYKPNGSLIAYSDECYGGDLDVCLLYPTSDPNDIGRSPITTNTNENCEWPSWSQDGNSIIYSCAPNGFPASAIFMIQNGGRPAQISVSDRDMDSEPAWRPSGP